MIINRTFFRFVAWKLSNDENDARGRVCFGLFFEKLQETDGIEELFIAGRAVLFFSEGEWGEAEPDGGIARGNDLGGFAGIVRKGKKSIDSNVAVSDGGETEKLDMMGAGFVCFFIKMNEVRHLSVECAAE